MSQPTRRRRANGIASRSAILDAAAEIAGERGYEGTSIKLVSERSGLPASSIYWHFKDKDDLIAAVIDRSFTDWIGTISAVPDLAHGDDIESLFVNGVRQAGAELTRFPDFLRLGLMLTLERRPVEASARRRFQQARSEAREFIVTTFALVFTSLGPSEVQRLATLTLATSDGLCIAADEDPDLDVAEAFELLAHAVLGAARSMGWQPSPVA